VGNDESHNDKEYRMSVDYYAYIKDIASFSTKNCERYISNHGIKIEIHPEYNAHSHTGFLPIRLEGDFISDTLAGKSFLSGFEICLNQYEYIPAKSEPKGLISRIFGKKAELHETPFDNAIKDASHYFSINCSSQDSFEILLAYAFSAYLCKDCAAILDDPQTGQFFDREKLITIEVDAIIDELKVMYQNGELSTHDFVEW